MPFSVLLIVALTVAGLYTKCDSTPLLKLRGGNPD